jgi:plastocyanin
MRRRSVGAIVACATLALPAVAAAKSKTVFSGGSVKFQNQIGKRFGTGVDAFMVPKVTINVGDTVVWDGKTRQNGFHTIDFPKKGGKPLPLVLPTGKLVTGVLDAANNPFWFNGKVPELGFNPALLAFSKGGTYNGSKAIDSGLPVLPKVADFKLKFTKAGTYKYYCNVHPGMVGVVVVLAKGKKVPSAKDDAKTVAKEQAAYIAGSKKLVKTKPTGANVDVGAAGANGLELFAMLPAKLTVKNGTTVKFSMAKKTRELHTATFGPSAYVNALAQAFGSSTVFPGNAIYPSDPPGTVTENLTSHGNGFANTGGLDVDKATPLPPSGTIKFTQPGTYNFICLVHPFMHGTVVVTP